MISTRILVLGAGGMLGHKLVQVLSQDFEVMGTVRSQDADPVFSKLAPKAKFLCGLSLDRAHLVEDVITEQKPNVVINCVGLVKQLPAAADKMQSIVVNALLPHRAAAACAQINARFIQISTDCVFSGSRGNYSEDDRPDCYDIYGMTKLLGEVSDRPNCLTLRTSIIGRQVGSSYALVEWFLKQNGSKVAGYTDAIFSGLTTLSLSQVISDIVAQHARLQGMYHVSSAPISKYELLHLLRDAYALDVQIEPSSSLHCDRSLNSRRFREATKIEIPSWTEMIKTMRADDQIYNNNSEPVELANRA